MTRRDYYTGRFAHPARGKAREPGLRLRLRHVFVAVLCAVAFGSLVSCDPMGAFVAGQLTRG